MRAANLILGATLFAAACTTTEAKAPSTLEADVVIPRPALCEAALPGATVTLEEMPDGLAIAFLGPQGQQAMTRQRLQGLALGTERQPVGGMEVERGTEAET